METRLISPADTSLLATMHAESFGASCWSEKQIAESIVLPTTRGWIAKEGNETIGFILCQITDREAEILTFCTSPRARGQGVATHLLLTARLAAKQKGATRLFLEVAADNEAALGLYAKHKFEATGSRRGYYRRGDTTIDAVILSIDL